MNKKYRLIKWYPGLPEDWKNQDVILVRDKESVNLLYIPEDKRFTKCLVGWDAIQESEFFQPTINHNEKLFSLNDIRNALVTLQVEGLMPFLDSERLIEIMKEKFWNVNL